MKALAFVLLAAGCFNQAADHCPGCTVVAARAAPPPRLPDGARALVVLVGGAFGFGDEWRPVVDRLTRARTPFFVFAWPGPWRDPSRPARALADALQRELDATPSLRRVLVLAHSAGGMLADWSVRQLRVPPGARVSLAAIAAPRGMNISPWVPDERPDTPLGFAVGGTQLDYPPVPARVEIIEYRTEDVPRAPEPSTVYLGAHTGHDASVAAAGLPLVEALVRAENL